MPVLPIEKIFNTLYRTLADSTADDAANQAADHAPTGSPTIPPAGHRPGHPRHVQRFEVGEAGLDALLQGVGVLTVFGLDGEALR
ncbi:hypothetical protein AB0F92_29500 [Kitasatospora aureofaciens]|uniref:hypothetical protein n=1 Tax=Kitasatospora aureofaciens TaxID=1894 RepID=UPI0033C119F3